MDKIDQQYFVDAGSKKIRSRTVWSRKYVTFVSSAKTEKFMSSGEEIEVFVNASNQRLTLIEQDKLEEYWKAKIGRVILLFRYQH